MVTHTITESEIFGEPTLDELLAEPIVRLVMKRDGVNEADMRGQIDRMLDAFRTLEIAQ